MVYADFDQSKDLVIQHAFELMMSQPAFKPALMCFALPDMPEQNHFMFEGSIKLFYNNE